MKLAELLLVNSGKEFQSSSYSGPCEISRTTVQNYLNIFEITHLFYVLRPWDRHISNEITRMPKVYAFDTGFIAFARGLTILDSIQKGDLWEHIVLGELLAKQGTSHVWYWRDKQQHEIDFVIAKQRQKEVHLIECKWNPRSFDPKAMKIFREKTPEGLNFVVSPGKEPPKKLRLKGLEYNEVSLQDLNRLLDMIK